VIELSVTKPPVGPAEAGRYARFEPARLEVGRCPLFVFEGGFTQLIDRIRAVAERVARSYDLEIFDVQFRREPVGWMLRVFVDVPFDSGAAWPDEAERQRRADASPTINDLELVSRDLSAILDVEETIDQSYTLEVSSPGLDRPLRTEADYRRFAGRLAKIVVSQPVDRQTHFEGRLGGVEGSSIVIETTPGKRQLIPLALVTRARLEVEF
jgi:ribosome maturation factor RimP